MNSWTDEMFTLMILNYIRIKGYSTINSNALKILKMNLMDYLKEILINVSLLTEIDQRTDSTVFDFLNVAKYLNEDVEGLITFAENNSTNHADSEQKVVNSFIIRNNKGIYERR